MRLFVFLIPVLLIGCDWFDNNSKEIFGSSTGLPKNCRAIIAANIDAYNRKEFPAEDALASIDRNCGRYGYSWTE